MGFRLLVYERHRSSRADEAHHIGADAGRLDHGPRRSAGPGAFEKAQSRAPSIASKKSGRTIGLIDRKGPQWEGFSQSLCTRGGTDKPR